MFLIIGALFLSGLGCEIDDNDPVTGLNPGCNYAGKCIPFIFGQTCSCCAPSQQDAGNICGEHWVCDPNNPTYHCLTFTGFDCNQVIEYVVVNFGFRVDDVDMDSPSNIECYTDPYMRATYGVSSNSSIDFDDQVTYLINEKGWPGPAKQHEKCDSCSPAYPCIRGVDKSLNVTSGMNFPFQVDINDFYDLDCGIDTWRSNEIIECGANYDHGQLAYTNWLTVRGGDGDDSFINDLTDLLWSEPNEANEYHGLGWDNSKILGFGEEVSTVTESDVIITLSPTKYPTETPTIDPTPTPTETPTHQCGLYFNNVEDIAFRGVGSNCRGGMSSSWPGGLSCDSPYVVCLPKENTPASDGFGGEPYKSVSYRYMVDECPQECAYDHRCLGAEFVADINSSRGDCNLINDIPPEIMSEVSGFNYDRDNNNEVLDQNVTGGDALCFLKED